MTYISKTSLKISTKIDKFVKENLKEKYEVSCSLYKEVNQQIDRLDQFYDEMTPKKVYTLFKRIMREDLLYFDMNPEHSHPIDCILTHVIVPPSTIRPTVQVINYIILLG